MRSITNPASVAFGLLGFIWGTNFLFMRWASEFISPSQIVFLRVLFGFVPILAYALLRGALSWKQLRHAHHFFVMSLLATTIYYYSFAKGASLLPSGIAGMLSGAIPLVSFVCAWLVLRSERPTGRMIAGLASGLIGICLIARPWAGTSYGVNPEGVMYMMIGCLSVGCSFVYARRFLAKLDLSPLALSTWQIGFALVTIGLTTHFEGMSALTQSLHATLGLAIGLGLTGTGVAYMLYYYIVQKLGALTASSVTYLPPVVASLIGVGFADEPLHVVNCIAMLCILGGVFLLQSRKPRMQGARILKTCCWILERTICTHR